MTKTKRTGPGLFNRFLFALDDLLKQLERERAEKKQSKNTLQPDPDPLYSYYAARNYCPERIKPEQEKPKAVINEQEETERLRLLLDSYCDIEKLIESEMTALQKEMQDPNITTNRETAINKRILVLAGKKTSNLVKIQSIEKKLEQSYDKLNN